MAKGVELSIDNVLYDSEGVPVPASAVGAQVSGTSVALVGGLSTNPTVDNATAIAAAVTAAPLGSTLVFPAGTYRLSPTWAITQDGITLRGQGQGATVLKLLDDSITASNGHLLNVTANKFEVSGITFDGNQSTMTTVRDGTEILQLGVENASATASTSGGTRYTGIRVHDCEFINGQAGHIRAWKCSRLWITNNRCDTVRATTDIAVSNIKLGWCFDFKVDGNYCDFGTQRGLGNNIFITHSGNSASGSQRGEVSGNKVFNCTDSPIEASSSTSGSALAAIVSHVDIHDNIVSSGAGIISLQSRHVDIHDNIIIGPGAGGGNAWGIRVGCSSGSSTTVQQDDVRVQNNVIVGSANTTRGIHLVASGGIVTRVSIRGNTIVDVTGAGSPVGILVDGSSVAAPNHTTNIDIGGNKVNNVATPVSIIGMDATAVVYRTNNDGDPDSSDTFGTGFPYAVASYFSASILALSSAGATLYERVSLAGTITKIGLHIGVSSGNYGVAVYRNSGSGRNAIPTTRLTGVGLTAARTVADAVTDGTATVTSATAAFLSTDVGKTVTGTNIPASTYVGIVNSATSIGLSSSASANTPVNASGSGSGGTLTLAAGVGVPASGYTEITLPSTVHVEPGDWLGIWCDNTTATFWTYASGGDSNLYKGLSFRQPGVQLPGGPSSLTATSSRVPILVGVP